MWCTAHVDAAKCLCAPAAAQVALSITNHLNMSMSQPRCSSMHVTIRSCALRPWSHCALQAEEVAQFSSKRMKEIEAELKEVDRSMVGLD